MTFARCINYGACTKADKKEKIPVAAGATDAVCPECGHSLVGFSPTVRPARLPLIGAVLVAAVIAAFLAWRVVGGGRQPSNVAAPGPAPTSAARAAAHSQPPVATVAMELCGSNTIGSQLGPDLVQAFLSSQGGTASSAARSGADEQTVQADLGGKPTSVVVAAHGSATAFTGLRSGSCQVGMASRRITSGEAASLHGLGNMISRASEHVIGLDGIAVIVNAANPVSSLSIAQLKDIFAGKMRSWSAVGGSNHAITVLARDDKSGTYDTFKSLVLSNVALAQSAKRFEDSAALSSAVAANTSAIGFVGLPYVAQAKALRISSGGTAIAPTPLTVGRETYPLSRRLFLYTASAPQNPLVGKFVSFVQSDAGQSIVNRDGFVGTVTSLATSKSSSRTLPASAPARYRHLVDFFDQTSFNLYFNTGSDILDNKALVDVGRLVDVLSQSRNRDKQVVLVGFADSTGDPANNVALSENRASAAAKEMEAQGIRVKDTMGFGQELPIRDNATEAGREKNRRVEIFLTR